MESKLHYNTTTPLLVSVLQKLMGITEFAAFRLVGGTGLSLQRGHRLSVDIDLFTNASYSSIDFEVLDMNLRSNWIYVDSTDIFPAGMGKSFFIGTGKDECIKLDLYYTDDFIDDYVKIDGIRMASVPEILAMKMDVIGRGGRKKDFWDLHELLNDFSLSAMLGLHQKRYPYSHNSIQIIEKLTDFSQADNDFDPICLRGKHWEIIKLDIIEFVAAQSAEHISL